MINSFQLPEGVEFDAGTNASMSAMAQAMEIRNTSFFVCTSGAAIIEINMGIYEVNQNTEVVLVPDTMFRVVGASPDYKCSYIIVARGLLEALGRRSDINLIRHLIFNPTRVISEEEMRDMVTHIYTLAATISRLKHSELQRIMILNTIGLYLAEISERSRELWGEETVKTSDRQTELFLKFLKRVRDDIGEHRDVEYYAEALSITPRYLSQICKKRQQSPKRIIDESLCFSAKRLLYGTNMTIQQIAEELNFPDQSVFTRFFRRIVGVTPTEWRENYWR
ncbi:MAG: helix-turn-helix domain-containing protein [Bacteroidales bacterium]|nr:helix-turn-helix domain-containing protein [Bacteroidales bacterium]